MVKSSNEFILINSTPGELHQENHENGTTVHAVRQKSLAPKDLIDFALQVARGMEFLAAHKVFCNI